MPNRLITYPLNNTDYSAEDAELFHCTRGSGIYSQDDFPLTIANAMTRQVTIGEGIGWIRNTKFSGKVIALKTPHTLTLPAPPANASAIRYDAVALEFNKSLNVTQIGIVSGEDDITITSNPKKPTPTRTESVYQLFLFLIRRSADESTNGIQIGAIEDVRLNSSYCGLMGDGAPGYTPIKGVDYWTPADKAEIINDVLTSLPNASGVEF